MKGLALNLLTPSQVYDALKHWHNFDNAGVGLLEQLFVVQANLSATIGALTGPVRRGATNKVILAGIGRLKTQNQTYAIVLENRFLSNFSILDTAQKLNLSSDSISRIQREAIHELVNVILADEMAVRNGILKKLIQSLPPATYSRLFGVDNQLETLAQLINSAETGNCILVTGIGGIGKTSLTREAVRMALPQSNFKRLCWVRYNPNNFTDMRTPELAFENILNGIIDNLGDIPMNTPSRHQQSALKRVLTEVATLVVIDNLEEPKEAAYLLENIHSYIGNSTFIITTRTQTYDQLANTTIRLDELTESDGLAFIRFEAEKRHLDALAQADDAQIRPIINLTGGNPLAIKLILGLLKSMPLSAALAQINRGKGEKPQKMYNRIYKQAWEILSDNARELLTSLPFSGNHGVSPEQLIFVSELEEDAFWEAINELSERSLVEIRGDYLGKTYGIHRLTETFLQTEIIDWPHSD